LGNERFNWAALAISKPENRLNPATLHHIVVMRDCWTWLQRLASMDSRTGLSLFGLEALSSLQIQKQTGLKPALLNPRQICPLD
jgi:hypothetical protein